MKLRMFIRGLKSFIRPTTPILAQLVVTRRCNLACGYCNEYDSYSNPVSTNELFERVDKLAELGTAVITLTGGETLLHPELDRVVRRIADHNMVCTSISNGMLLSREWIDRLNEAGLYLLQISVDNLDPNATSQKSLVMLKKRLPLLREHARFDVNVNAVLGSCPADETRELVRQVRGMGFFMTVGLLHGTDGMLDRGLLDQKDLEDIYAEMNDDRRRSLFHRFGEGWETEMIRTGQSDWKCRAGARYLYIDEFGRVSYCSQRRGEPGILLADYTREHARSYFVERKGCEPNCTIACVRRASSLDTWRGQESQERRHELAAKPPIPAEIGQDAAA